MDLRVNEEKLKGKDHLGPSGKKVTEGERKEEGRKIHWDVRWCAFGWGLFIPTDKERKK